MEQWLSNSIGCVCSSHIHFATKLQKMASKIHGHSPHIRGYNLKKGAIWTHSLRTCIDGKKINWPNGQSNQENKIIVIKNI